VPKARGAGHRPKTALDPQQPSRHRQRSSVTCLISHAPIRHASTTIRAIDIFEQTGRTALTQQYQEAHEATASWSTQAQTVWTARHLPARRMLTIARSPRVPVNMPFQCRGRQLRRWTKSQVRQSTASLSLRSSSCSTAPLSRYKFQFQFHHHHFPPTSHA
jgi:hypothetical protein